MKTLENFVEEIRLSDFTFALLLLLLVMLNLVDFALTARALSFGYKEGNPIIKYLFGLGPEFAGYFKIGMAVVFALVTWVYRRHRSVVVATLFVVGIYLDLILYHLMGDLLVISR